jgi:hypothetical protein
VPGSNRLAVLMLAAGVATACWSERGRDAASADAGGDAATRRAVVEGVAARVQASYVFRDRAAFIAARSRARQGDD